MAFGVQQEWLERKFPSPHEWSWITRKNFRSAKWDEDHDVDGELIDWARTGEAYQQLLKRLEDPNIDGAGLEDQDEGGILVAGIGKTGFDISKKPEPWRRGYYEILMGAARAAEHLDGWVRDKTRNVAFPGSVVIGPSNPNPRPLPPGAKSAPREEDCEAAFEPPETYYMRVLTTQGLTEKQRLDAALAYGAWLDFKRTPQAALEMYKWALDIATSKFTSAKPIIDPTTGVLNTDAITPSANLLSATTALAVHHALNSNLSLALPMLLSVLRARRSLPEAPATMRSTLNANDDEDSGFLKNLMYFARSALVQSKYPSPPDDGTSPPMRSSKERCEEAGIMTYVGEILYASNSGKTSKEEGLAWTREAVDIAEEELRAKAANKEAKKICKQCLEVGLGNWATMVTKLAREEKATKTKKVGGWLGFGVGEQKDFVGRWESEQLVVKERMRRAKEVLSSPMRNTGGGSSFLSA
jgi:hypothetical protein